MQTLSWSQASEKVNNMEQTLQPTVNGKYLNLQIKPKKGVGGLTNGNHIVVEKSFADGTPIPSTLYKNKDGSPQVSFSCKVKYNGQDVSFFLNEAEHSKFAAIGGIGDKVKITLTKEPMVNPISGIEMLVPRLNFEAA